MTIIYGRSDAEKSLLEGLPDKVKTVDDISTAYKETKQELTQLKIKELETNSDDGRKNLKSSQMDFVVVSKRGIILIEAKNWANSTRKDPRKYLRLEY